MTHPSAEAISSSLPTYDASTDFVSRHFYFPPPTRPLRIPNRSEKPHIWAKDYACPTINNAVSNIKPVTNNLSLNFTLYLISNFISYDSLSSKHQSFVAFISFINEPFNLP